MQDSDPILRTCTLRSSSPVLGSTSGWKSCGGECEAMREVSPAQRDALTGVVKTILGADLGYVRRSM